MSRPWVPRTPSYQHVRPGGRVLALLATPADPGLLPAEAEIVAARVLSNLGRPCPLCGEKNVLPEWLESGTVRGHVVTHEPGCPVADDLFRARVLKPFHERHGRTIERAVVVCQVRPDWTLEPIEVAA